MSKISKEYTFLKPIFMLFLQVFILINIFYILSSQNFMVNENEIVLLFYVVAIVVLGLMTFKSLARLKEQEAIGSIS